MDEKNQCRCPVRPLYTQGSLASGSNHEAGLMARWHAEHGGHPYAKARDELARALQAAERDVGSGEAVLDMVRDVFGLSRESHEPSTIREVFQEADRRHAAIVDALYPSDTNGGELLDAARLQVLQRLRGEAGINAMETEVRAVSLETLTATTAWLDALLRRKEGNPREGDAYDFPAWVSAVVQREAQEVASGPAT